MGRKVLLAALSTLVSLAAAEALARLASPLPPESSLALSQRLEHEAAPLEPLLRRLPGPGEGLWVVDRADARKEPFPVRPPPGRLLAVLAGESVAELLPTPLLRAALERALGRPVLLVNAGVGGDSVSAVRANVGQLARLHPGLMIVLAGNNPIGLLLPRWLARAQARSRLLQLALQVARRGRDTNERFERELGAIADEAGAARLVLCTLPINRDCPPSGELPLSDREFRLGWRAWRSGRPGEAARRWRRFLSGAPGSPMGHYWLGRALSAQGRAREAHAELQAAVSGPWRGRCTEDRNAAIRRVAARKGAALADLEAAFDAAGAGGDAFNDVMHWHEAWKPFAAAVIAAAAAGRVPPRPEPAPPRSPLAPPRLVGYDLLLACDHQALLSEDVVFAFERLWRQRPGLLREALSSRRQAARAMGGLRGLPPRRLSAADWSAILAYASEARRRRPPLAGRGRQGRARQAREKPRRQASLKSSPAASRSPRERSTCPRRKRASPRNAAPGASAASSSRGRAAAASPASCRQTASAKAAAASFGARRRARSSRSSPSEKRPWRQRVRPSATTARSRRASSLSVAAASRAASRSRAAWP